MTRRALVTGAGGFIGSHLADLLVREGYSVRSIVHYRALDQRAWLDDVANDIASAMEVVAGDVRDAGFMRHVARDVDVIFHLAALIGIPYSYVAPESYVGVNIQGTLNVLQAGREVGAKVIHTSTSEVYGTAQHVPIDETHPLSAQSPYAASKIAADQLALSFHRSFGLPVVVVRPFNTYGPRQSRRAVIPTIVTQLLAGQRTLRLGSISPTRDLTFVRDTVSGFIAADRAEAAIGEVVNLGTGYEISIGELASIIASEIGADVTIEEEAARIRPAGSEVERLLSNNAKAAKVMDWHPMLAGADGLRIGLRLTIDWFRRRGLAELADAREYGI